MGIFKRHQLACAVALATLGVAATAVADESGAADDVMALDEITVVTAAGYEQNIADAPASISVITREQLEKQSYTDITDAVRNIPGVYVTGGGNMQDISIRGMSSPNCARSIFEEHAALHHAVHLHAVLALRELTSTMSTFDKGFLCIG